MSKISKAEADNQVKTTASDMFFLAALAYLSLLIEPIIRSIIINNLFERLALGEFGWTLVLRGACITLWLLCARSLLIASKKNCAYNVFEKSEPPTNIQWGLAVGTAVLFVAFGLWDNYEKNIAMLSAIDGITSVINLITMYIFYAVEALIIIFVIAFGQKGGELAIKTKKGNYIPYGGIFLGLCWAIVNFITYMSTLTSEETVLDALGSAAMMILYGIIFGVFYVLIGKKTRYALPIIVIAFVLM